MAIYAEEYQRQPNESFYDYLMRMNKIRASGMLGNYRETQGAMPAGGTGPSPVSDQLGQQTVREITDAQRAAMAQRASGGDEYMPERDTPEAQAARRQAALDKQIKVALGMDVRTNADLTKGLGVINPLLGGFGYLADTYEKDVAALALGRQLGIDDVAKAKEIGYNYLNDPTKLQGLVNSGAITLTPEKPKKSMIASLFNIDLGDDDPAPAPKPPVYDSISDMKIAEIADVINSSGGMFQDTEDNDGSSIGYVPPSQQPKTSPGAGRGGFNPTVVSSGSDDNNTPSGGGTPLSEVGGTVESIANANQDAAYEAMGGLYS